jgi:hypothetical protein
MVGRRRIPVAAEKRDRCPPLVRIRDPCHARKEAPGRFVGDLLVAPVTAGDLTEDADIVRLGRLHPFSLCHDDAVYATLLDWLRTEDHPGRVDPVAHDVARAN